MALKIQYLEIVTDDVQAVCATYEALYDLTFGEPNENLGNARTADLDGGALLGVRAPLRDDEEPVVRPYCLVDDLEKAIANVEDNGGTIAHPPMEIPGLGTFAIYLQGGNDHGLWQV